MFAPFPSDVFSARVAAGLSQSQAAQVVGLSSGVRWSEYERGVRRMDAARWELFLLLTGQHPRWQLVPRHPA